MTRFQKENLKIRILRLITRKSTGSPEELALMLDVSTRTAKRLIHELREEGYFIRYSRMSRSYIPA
jgi:DeoR/GlpR family transcriptional regulator of sugar metabolism